MDFDRKWFVILFSLLVQVYCRPQRTEYAASPLEYLPNGVRYPKWLPHPQLGLYDSTSNSLKTNFLFYPLQYNLPLNAFQRFKVNQEESEKPNDSEQKPPSLAPYRFHPLFHYIKNENTINPNKIIKFRNPNQDEKDVTTLILKPVARSVAGVDGKAIATPVSKAILRKGTSVDILFEPDAIAIAGPGGIAHAESDLEISYEDDKSEDKISVLPFYGGAKGQSLEIIEKPDGAIITNIIKTPQQTDDTFLQNNINPTELENPPLPTKFDTDDFSENLRKIQNLALRIIKLQEILKETGSLSPTEEAAYKENMEILSESAQKLAEIQEVSNPVSIENREGISAWLENRKSTTNKTKPKKKEGEDQKKKEDDKKRKEDEEKRKKEKKKNEELDAEKKKAEKEKEEKQNEKEENKEGEKVEHEDGETIGIDLPPEDASVAEAKPVGLAVAGIGGVASSKPIATAVVGPGGLAVARPISTAIAGVDPEQALIPIYGVDFVLGSKPHKSGGSEKANEYLSRLISKFHQN